MRGSSVVVVVVVVGWRPRRWGVGAVSVEVSAKPNKKNTTTQHTFCSFAFLSVSKGDVFVINTSDPTSLPIHRTHFSLMLLLEYTSKGVILKLGRHDGAPVKSNTRPRHPCPTLTRHHQSHARHVKHPPETP